MPLGAIDSFRPGLPYMTQDTTPLGRPFKARLLLNDYGSKTERHLFGQPSTMSKSFQCRSLRGWLAGTLPAVWRAQDSLGFENGLGGVLSCVIHGMFLSGVKSMVWCPVLKRFVGLPAP